MVWYQKFEYAVGHWLQKTAEHVFGCVLCSPGCFSLFRGAALMDDNVMKRYTTKASEASHCVQYDQGNVYMKLTTWQIISIQPRLNKFTLFSVKRQVRTAGYALCFCSRGGGLSIMQRLMPTPMRLRILKSSTTSADAGDLLPWPTPSTSWAQENWPLRRTALSQNFTSCTRSSAWQLPSWALPLSVSWYQVRFCLHRKIDSTLFALDSLWCFMAKKVLLKCFLYLTGS